MISSSTCRRQLSMASVMGDVLTKEARILSSCPRLSSCSRWYAKLICSGSTVLCRLSRWGMISATYGFSALPPFLVTSMMVLSENPLTSSTLLSRPLDDSRNRRAWPSMTRAVSTELPSSSRRTMVLVRPMQSLSATSRTDDLTSSRTLRAAVQICS
ncbi:hypothetical protein HYQ46_000379 [Verticillium longisporum]|nr:hypothetical protein HYQ46_000379 [Verticillium longisporum]